MYLHTIGVAWACKRKKRKLVILDYIYRGTAGNPLFSQVTEQSNLEHVQRGAARYE